MRPPPNLSITRKVERQEFCRIFNDPIVRAELVRRTTQKVDHYYGLAAPEYNQEPGTTSHVYDWMEHHPVNGTTLLATVKCFRKPDGSLGASGDYDPVLFLFNGEVLYDP